MRQTFQLSAWFPCSQATRQKKHELRKLSFHCSDHICRQFELCCSKIQIESTGDGIWIRHVCTTELVRITRALLKKSLLERNRGFGWKVEEQMSLSLTSSANRRRGCKTRSVKVRAVRPRLLCNVRAFQCEDTAREGVTNCCRHFTEMSSFEHLTFGVTPFLFG